MMVALQLHRFFFTGVKTQENFEQRSVNSEYYTLLQNKDSDPQLHSNGVHTYNNIWHPCVAQKLTGGRVIHCTEVGEEG